MTDGNTPYSGTVATDSILNHTTHLSGSTSERTSSTNWPTYMPYFDTTLQKWYRNIGSSGTPTSEEIGSTGAIGDICYELSVSSGDYIIPASMTATSTVAGSSFSDDYSSATGWTQTGTLVTVNSGLAGEVKAAAVDLTTHNRVAKSLGFTLSDTLWIYQFDFIVTSMAANRSAVLAALTSTNGTMVSADTIMVAIIDTAGTKTLRVRSYDGGVFTADSADSSAITTGVRYYGRLQRTSATTVILKIFTDSGRTTQLGSTVTDTINSTCGGLQYLQHGSYAAGNPGETGTFNLDNSVIPSPNAALSAYDSSLSTYWESTSETGPAIYGDFTSARNYVGFSLALHLATTTVTQIQLSISTDTTFSGEVVRTINVSDFTTDTRRYILININRTAARYVQIKGVGTGVLAVTEFAARYGVTGDTLFFSHYHQPLNKTTVVSTAVDSN